MHCALISDTIIHKRGVMGFEYTVQPQHDGRFKIHKWEEGNSIPVATYTIWARDSKVDCSCPSGRYRGYCKHKDIFRKFKKTADNNDTITFFKVNV